MTKYIIALMLAVPLCFFFLFSFRAVNRSHSSASAGPDSAYQKITAEQARAKMEEVKAFILLDVRTEAEYKEGHIEGAILMPVDSIGMQAESALKEKDAILLVYCRSGRRSANAARELAAMGYTNVFDFGGIIDWPFEITKE